MSLICLCVVENIRKNSEIVFYKQQLETVAKHHKRGVKFSVDWSEPIISHIQKDSFIINITDCPESDNCELFLLPDGWYVNGYTNKLPFRERMKFLQDISNIFNSNNYNADLYLGLSGTEPEDFLSITLKNNNLVDYLSDTVGVNGIDFDGVRIKVVS